MNIHASSCTPFVQFLSNVAFIVSLDFITFLMLKRSSLAFARHGLAFQIYRNAVVKLLYFGDFFDGHNREELIFVTSRTARVEYTNGD